MTQSEQAQAVYIHSKCEDITGLLQLCKKTNTPVYYNDSAFKRINQKENTYVLGMFTKYQCNLSPDSPHILMVNPGDMGNLGSIVRTVAGVNLTNIAIILPAADIWHPKTIRASMGAIFKINVEQYSSFEQYSRNYTEHMIYPFMLDGKLLLRHDTCPREDKYSLVFGCEASGLPEMYHRFGMSMRLPQTHVIDSYNISVAVGMGAAIFACANGQV